VSREQKHSFERSVDAFCSEIENVLAISDESHREYLKTVGHTDVKLGHKMMDDLITRWTANIPKLKRV